MQINSTNEDDELFSCLISAMFLAKNKQIQKASVLKEQLQARGFSDDIIDKSFMQFGSAIRSQTEGQ